MFLLSENSFMLVGYRQSYRIRFSILEPFKKNTSVQIETYYMYDYRLLLLGKYVPVVIRRSIKDQLIFTRRKKAILQLPAKMTAPWVNLNLKRRIIVAEQSE